MNAPTKRTKRAAAKPAALTAALAGPQNEQLAWQDLRAYLAPRKKYLSIAALGGLCEPKLSRAQALALLSPPEDGHPMRVAATAARLEQLQAAAAWLCGYQPRPAAHSLAELQQ